MDNQDQIEDQQLMEALKLLEQTPEVEDTLAEVENSEEINTSPTLDALDKARLPKVKTACQACPNSMWFSSPEEVKCYCRIMHTISWGGNDSSLITKCDGLFLD